MPSAGKLMMISPETDPNDQLLSHIMKTRYWSLVPLLTLSLSGFSQNLEYAKEVIAELCSDEMAGRGYVNDGDNAAAYYIEKEFDRHGLKPWAFDYNQQFAFQVNAFPDKVVVALDDVDLQPGADFIVSPGCPSVSGEFPTMEVHKFSEINDRGVFKDSANFQGMVLVVQDSVWYKLTKNGQAQAYNALRQTGCAGLIKLTNKLTWGVARDQDPLPVVEILNSSWSPSSRIKLNINAELKKKHRTQNVLGYFEGNEEPEKFIVFTGHYDHLGMMGQNAMFKGANDNASGIAMMLNMVEYYSDEKNRGKYSIAFMAFAGEEAGLMGSFYYVQNPLFPLENIEFLINVDLMGTGEDGVTIVNGAIHEGAFNSMVSINETNQYLKRIKKRGKAANSDHYPFSEKGVPAFFLYTMGGITAYHDIYDLPETLPLTEFEDVFRLIRDFNDRLQE